MKKIMICAATLALLSACGQEAGDAPAEDTAAVAEPAGDTMEDYLGSWDAVYPDGSTAKVTNFADGTYTRENPDGTSSTGTWTYGADKSCWSRPDAEDVCYTVGPPDETGTRILTMDDGSEVFVTPSETGTGEEAM